MDVEKTIIAHLLEQIDDAKPEIDGMEAELEVPLQTTNLFESSPWGSFYDRCKGTAVTLTQLLFANKEDLLSAKGFFFNKLLSQVSSSFEDEVSDYISNNINSISVSSYLCKNIAKLASSFEDCSRSNNYPDLIRTDFEYDFLPRKSNDGSAALKSGRAINVPDGVEVKTSRNHQITLDCHGPKMGSFVYAPWHIVGKEIKLLDIYLAFLKKTDFNKGGSSSKQTTPKWNIKDTSVFISLVTGQLYNTGLQPSSINENTSLFEFKSPEIDFLKL